MDKLNIPVDLIWGEKDPWEPISEAYNWKETISCIQSINVIALAGHCVHDETPNEVNSVLTKLIKSQNWIDQQAT
jgi:pimeloyl-ACP methyl ester carboxylesterase